MRRVAFLCSGGGGNLRFVRRCLAAGFLGDLELVGVVSDRACGAVDWARREGVPSAEVRYSRVENRDLLRALQNFAPDLIVTTFDRILDAETVAAFDGKTVNLHYSLLPAFAGLTGDVTIRRALESGCKILGTTIHRIVEAVDSGPILAQSAVAVRAGEPFEETLQRVFRSGAVNLAGALRRLAGSAASGVTSAYRFDVESLFSPAVDFADGLFGESFWADFS